jgi:hypothetical protein
MSYYMAGDFYRGAVGDPFLGGLIPALGGLIKLGVRKLLPRAVGAAGAVATGVALARPPVAPPTGIPLPGPFRAHPGALLPGGRPFITREVAPGGGCPPGFHLNKARSYRFGMEAGSYCVRNRRMNPANPRALRRSIRRERGFIALARRTLRGTGITIGRRSIGKKARKR